MIIVKIIVIMIIILIILLLLIIYIVTVHAWVKYRLYMLTSSYLGCTSTNIYLRLPNKTAVFPNCEDSYHV